MAKGACDISKMISMDLSERVHMLRHFSRQAGIESKSCNLQSQFLAHSVRASQRCAPSMNNRCPR